MNRTVVLNASIHLLYRQAAATTCVATQTIILLKWSTLRKGSEKFKEKAIETYIPNKRNTWKSNKDEIE